MVSSQLEEGTHPEAWESLRLGGQAKKGIHTTSHWLFPMDQEPGCSSPCCPADGVHSTVTAGPALENFKFRSCRAGLPGGGLFFNNKRESGPSFLLGTLEVSPSTDLTPTSLPAASKGRVGGRTPFARLLPSSPSSLPEAAGQKGRGL